jgi:hypothetical protein
MSFNFAFFHYEINIFSNTIEIGLFHLFTFFYVTHIPFFFGWRADGFGAVRFAGFAGDCGGFRCESQ